ncbi:hypothetical protein O7630_35530 [Micromonospora sp. WMMD718]|uniref:hypothetical protein n=1 Tax=Micromonospora sp. WMMD718 TaxID=3016098 RepID=UPI002418131C|nr:hypothetical protein [Micromonospora sp. WMMD718]MDG4756262.1 hypothetical protein [Micromonospora sp. WMMD718]
MSRNEKFAAARAAKRLTGGQLAELVADRVLDRTTSAGSKRRRPPIDADYVSRIERGLITWPGRDYREAFQTVLGAKSAAELGFYSRRTQRTEQPLPVDIDGQLLALAGAATIGALSGHTLTALTSGLAAPPTPSRIGHIDVADLHRVIDGMERADHAAGGRTVVRSLALGQLAWTQNTLQTASFRSTVIRAAWMAAVARLGRLAGFMSVDARDHETARRCFLIALQIAAEAENWPSRLNVLSGMARQAVHLGEGAAALQITTLARAGEGSASTTTKAMIRVLEARAYGVLGRTSEAVSAVRQADDLYEQRRPDDDPPWLWFYDDAQLMGDTGHALFPLALAGIKVDAVRRLRLAVDMHDPADTRGRVFSLIKLATLEVRHEPGPTSFATAQEAITAVAGLRSGRALDYLNDLGRALRREGSDDARALASQVSSTLKAVRRD